jgi:Delta7-sterol 5-desaturase
LYKYAKKFCMKQFIHYLGYFSIILSAFCALYFLMAGTAYWFFYIRKSPALAKARIQTNYPTRQSIRREIKWSLITMVIVSIITQVTLVMVEQGYSKMYFSFARYGGLYFAATIIGGILLNDTYFYWMHRFMHLKKVFPYVHRIHHLSKTPTPWAIYSFSPAEAFLNFLFFPALVFLLPMHPLAIGAVFFYNIASNTTGHLGFEIIPQRLRHFWIFHFYTSVTHHDMHHTKVKYNFGLYFNIWDWLMKTNHADYKQSFHTKKTLL